MAGTTPQTQQTPFPFDKARESILTIPQVKEVKFVRKDDDSLDSIRVLSDGSLPDKQVASKIQSMLLLDLDVHVDYRIIKVVSRSEKPRKRTKSR